MRKISVGDIVVALDAVQPLRSRFEIYTHAICVQEEPLVLVSEGADMMWQSSLDGMPLRSLSKAHPDVFKVCMERFEFEMGWQAGTEKGKA